MSENTPAVPSPPLAPATPKTEAEKKIERILDQVRGYHLALDMREHGSQAAWRALHGIEEILGVKYVQGVEEARQRTGK